LGVTKIKTTEFHRVFPPLASLSPIKKCSRINFGQHEVCKIKNHRVTQSYTEFSRLWPAYRQSKNVAELISVNMRFTRLKTTELHRVSQSFTAFGQFVGNQKAYQTKLCV